MERLAREGGAGTFDLVFIDGDKARRTMKGPLIFA